MYYDSMIFGVCNGGKRELCLEGMVGLTVWRMVFLRCKLAMRCSWLKANRKAVQRLQNPAVIQYYHLGLSQNIYSLIMLDSCTSAVGSKTSRRILRISGSPNKPL